MIQNNRISFEDWCIKNKKQTLLNQWNIERNGELSPKYVSFGSDKLVWWKDLHGNEWQARVSSRTSNKSRGLSPFKDGKLPIIGVNDLVTTHPEITKEFHPTLNGELTPNKIKAGSNKSVWWICPKGHIHKASPWTRTQGHKCPYCTGRKVLVGYNDLPTTHPEIARTFHPTFNGDVTVSMISAGMNRKYWWLCSNNHSYQATPYQRTHHRGCPICAGKKLLKGFNDLQTRNPKVAMEWHPTKNGDLKPDQVFPFTNRKAWWKCDHNHEWEATINSRQQNGCPDCYKALRTSLREKTVFYYIHKYFPTSISNYMFAKDSRSEIDIYVPEAKLGIEYDGVFYHVDAERDLRKNDKINNHGINLIRLREPKLPLLPPKNTTQYIQLKNLSDRELENAIKKVLSIISKKLDQTIDFQVCINENTTEIYELAQLSRINLTFAEARPDLIQYWNQELNGLVKPEDVHANSTRKFWFNCERGHTYQSKLNNAFNNKRCPYCYGNHSILPGENDLQTVRPLVALQWHPTKNGTLTPSMVRAFSHKPVWWKCRHGKEWFASPAQRKSDGCSCTREKRLKRINREVFNQTI